MFMQTREFVRVATGSTGWTAVNSTPCPGNINLKKKHSFVRMTRFSYKYDESIRTSYDSRPVIYDFNSDVNDDVR